MEARITNLPELLPAALKALQGLYAAAHSAGVPEEIMGLVHLRASQINGCSFCVDYGARHAKRLGETDQRLFAVAAWRDTSYFTPAERAALALAEAATRLSDREDPVPDAIWEEAARHFSQKELAALTVWIGLTNLYNRVNVTTRLPAGAFDPDAVRPQVSPQTVNA